MAKCRDQNIPPNEHSHAMSLREHCAKFGLKNGNISEDFLDDLEIYSTPGTVRRDHLTECRQHAFLVTHVDSAARALKKRESNNGEDQKQRKADFALIAKAEAAATKKNQREAQRAIERERFAALAPEEQRSERQASRAAAAERRRLREHEKLLKIDAAKIRVNGSTAL